MRTLKATVVSDKMSKTRVVEITRQRKHPRYLKYVKITNRLKVHDEENAYNTGDMVIIQETRPMSKDKHWKIIGLSTNIKSVANKRINESEHS